MASWTRHMCPLSKRCWWCNPNGMSQLCDWKRLFVASNVYGPLCGPRSGVDFILLKISGTCMFFWRWRMSFQQRRQRTHSQVARDKWSPRPDRCLCSRAFCRCVPEGTLLYKHYNIHFTLRRLDIKCIPYFLTSILINC